jgi:hypothetical protein
MSGGKQIIKTNQREGGCRQEALQVFNSLRLLKTYKNKNTQKE